MTTTNIDELIAAYNSYDNGCCSLPIFVDDMVEAILSQKQRIEELTLEAVGMEAKYQLMRTAAIANTNNLSAIRQAVGNCNMAHVTSGVQFITLGSPYWQAILDEVFNREAILNTVKDAPAQGRIPTLEEMMITKEQALSALAKMEGMAYDHHIETLRQFIEQQPASKPSRFTMLGMASIEIYGQVHFIPVRAYEAIKENAIADFIKRMPDTASKPSVQVPIFQYIPIGYVNEESEAFVPNHTFDEGALPGWEVTYVCRRLNQSQEVK